MDGTEGLLNYDITTIKLIAANLCPEEKVANQLSD